MIQLQRSRIHKVCVRLMHGCSCIMDHFRVNQDQLYLREFKAGTVGEVQTLQFPSCNGEISNFENMLKHGT